MNEPKKIELIETVRGRWYWFVDDGKGGFIKSEIYRTEENAWRAMFENKIDWGIAGSRNRGYPHGPTTRIISRELIEEFCDDCGARVKIERREDP